MNFFGFGYAERILILRYGNLQAADEMSKKMLDIRCQTRADINNDVVFFVSNCERDGRWLFLDTQVQSCVFVSLLIKAKRFFQAGMLVALHLTPRAR